MPKMELINTLGHSTAVAIAVFSEAWLQNTVPDAIATEQPKVVVILKICDFLNHTQMIVPPTSDFNI